MQQDPHIEIDGDTIQTAEIDESKIESEGKSPPIPLKTERHVAINTITSPMLVEFNAVKECSY